MNIQGKKLYRDTDDVWVAGVISGFADYFTVDVTFLRILTIVAFIVTGLFPGVIFYIIAWIMIPPKGAVTIHDVDVE